MICAGRESGGTEGGTKRPPCNPCASCGWQLEWPRRAAKRGDKAAAPRERSDGDSRGEPVGEMAEEVGREGSFLGDERTPPPVTLGGDGLGAAPPSATTRCGGGEAAHELLLEEA